MLSAKEQKQLREAIVECQRPLYYYHDDPDGLASYIMCQQLSRGSGVALKAHPHLTSAFLHKIEEVRPEKVIILDIAQADQEFVDKCGCPVIWIDHHDVAQIDNALYFNPRKNNINVPTPGIIWSILEEKEREATLWVATIGCIGDWYMPEFAEEFSEKYPEILPKKVKRPEEALFDTKAGVLARVFSFILKGRTGEVNKAVRILSKITDPYEILEKKTPHGKMLFEIYEEVNEQYQIMLEKAMTKAEESKELVVHTYVDDRLSLTKDLANEMLYRYRKPIVLGRDRLGEIRCSLRSPPEINIKEALEKALVGVEGYGGGHENACGAAIKKDDFPRFIDNLKKALSKI